MSFERSRSIQAQERQGVFLLLCVGFGVMLALGGATQPLSLGLWMAFLGLVLIARPVNRPVWGYLIIPVVLMLVWIGLSFLIPAPATDWREQAISLGIPIATTVTAQPWVSVQAILPLVAAILFMGLALQAAPSGGKRLQALTFLTVVLIILGFFSLLGQALGWRLPWADQVQIFSWLPNRNQSALVFACGALASAGLGFYLIGINRYRAMGFLLGALVLLLATFQSLSRGALIALVVGGLLLAWSLWRERHFGPAWLVPLVGALLAFTLFSFLGGQARDRTLALFDRVGDESVGPDFRISIYQDTLSMVGDQPLTGVGLGQFRYVFPQYRSAAGGELTLLHPESDWLWWAAELGLPGVGLILLLLILLLYRLKLLVRDAEWPLRWVAFAALVPFMVHSLVDVGAHRLGTVTLVTLLYVLALPSSDIVQCVKPRRFYRQLSRVAGVILIISGAGLAWLGWRASPLLVEHASGLAEPHEQVPMQWQPYFRRGAAEVVRNPRASRTDFRRARFLEPVSAELPMREGRFLLRYSKPGAFAAFGEAIRRSPNPELTFQQVLGRTARDPESRVYLRQLATWVPDGLTFYLRTLPRNQLIVDGALEPGLIRQWPTFSAGSKKAVIDRLLTFKAPEIALILIEKSDPDLRASLWRQEVLALMQLNDNALALAIIDQHVPPPVIPEAPTISETAMIGLRRDYIINPDDRIAARRLLNAYWRLQQWEEVARLAARLRNQSDGDKVLVQMHAYALQQMGEVDQATAAYRVYLTAPR